MTATSGVAASRHPHRAVKRVALSAASALVAVNIFTGCPLLALWVGSISVGGQILSMTSVGVVVVVFAILVYGMAALLVRLSSTYDDLVGRPQTEQRATWLESMRAEGERDQRERVGMTAVERVVVTSVYAAAIGLTIWFVFYSGIPLMNPSAAS
jgi:hypothetical protein